MAVTVLNHIGECEGRPAEHLKNAIRYILNPKKTEAGLWVGGNVGREAEPVLQAMLDTKRDWQKLSGRQGYHFVISFRPGETDEKTAFHLVKDFCEMYLGEIMITVFPSIMIGRICMATSFLIRSIGYPVTNTAMWMGTGRRRSSRLRIPCAGNTA